MNHLLLPSLHGFFKLASYRSYPGLLSSLTRLGGEGDGNMCTNLISFFTHGKYFQNRGKALRSGVAVRNRAERRTRRRCGETYGRPRGRDHTDASSHHVPQAEAHHASHPPREDRPPAHQKRDRSLHAPPGAHHHRGTRGDRVRDRRGGRGTPQAGRGKGRLNC